MENKSERVATTHVRVFKKDQQRLSAIRETIGFKSVAWIVHRLLQEQAKNLASVESVMNGTVPVVLVGRPLSGKTYFVRHKLLPSLLGTPVLVIDSWDEYKELRNMSYDIYGLSFSEFNEHIRFVPNKHSRMGEIDVENIFAHIDMKRSEMRNWTIIVEEAHSYKNIQAFNKFLYGSRHIVRKMIAVTPQVDAFQGIVALAVLSSSSSR